MGTTTARGFRSDIQGLRAIAVLLVLVYHAGVPFVPGGYVGVDVFFVVSGFLITGQLIASLDRHGRIDFVDFYAKRVRRILPASIVVLLLTLWAAVTWVPPLQWQTMLRDALATAAYVPNVWFAMEDTDYLAETAPSMFQHYWSLGVEEQFYLFWPALLGAGFLLVRRSRRRLMLLVAGVVAASFCYSVWLLGESQAWAFFSLPSRAWELGVGGLLAFLLSGRPRWTHGAAVAALGWAGLLGLGVVAAVFDEATSFPGVNALLPVAATAAVIIGCTGDHPWNPLRLLSLAPLQWFGMISYSLYLVHWPLLVIPQAAIGLNTPLLPEDKLLLAGVAIPIAHLLYTFVENPGRKAGFLIEARPIKSVLTGSVASLAVLALTAGSLVLTSRTELSSNQAAAAVGPDLMPVGTEFVPENLTPSLQEAENDNPAIYNDGCHQQFEGSDPAGCLVGENRDAPLVALFGDSHAAQWYPALARLAEDGRIRLDTNTKSSCPSVMVDVVVDGTEYTDCGQWRAGVIERLNEAPPDLVLLANYGRADLEGGDDRFDTAWAVGLEQTVAALPDSRVAVLSDTPDMGSTPAICLSSHLDDAFACARPANEALNKEVRAAEQSVEGVEYVDVTGYFCDQRQCPAVIGSTLVYRDAHHMTATFSAGLADVLGTEIERLLAAAG